MTNSTTETRNQIEAAEAATIEGRAAACEAFSLRMATATKSIKAYASVDAKADNARAKAATAKCAASVDLWLLVSDGDWVHTPMADGTTDVAKDANGKAINVPKAYGKQGLEALFTHYFCDPLGISLPDCRQMAKAGALIEGCKAAGIDPVTNVKVAQAIWSGIGKAAGSGGKANSENIAQAVSRVILMREIDPDGDSMKAAQRAALCDTHCGGEVETLFAKEQEAQQEREDHAEQVSTPEGKALYKAGEARKALDKIEDEVSREKVRLAIVATFGG